MANLGAGALAELQGDYAGANALVQVFMTAPDGVVRGFLYSFTAEGDGWKIDGVQPLGPQPLRHLHGLHI